MSTDWPDGVGRVVLPECDSTNAEAARRAAAGGAPLWVLAQRQTAGRGRRGRAWHDPPGNFAASHLCRAGLPGAQLALHSFVAALALHDALVTATGRPDSFALKWPNDVLLHGGKLAGILLERPGGAAAGHLVIGVGVNLQAHPPPAPDAVPPVSLQGETGLTLPPEALLDLLAPAFARWQAVLLAQGFAPVRAAWLARAARLGQPIVARTVRDTHSGRFDGIDATGALLLRDAGGTRAIAAAEVFF